MLSIGYAFIVRTRKEPIETACMLSCGMDINGQQHELNKYVIFPPLRYL